MCTPSMVKHKIPILGRNMFHGYLGNTDQWKVLAEFFSCTKKKKTVCDDSKQNLADIKFGIIEIDNPF